MIEELDEREIDAFLRRQLVGRVGCHAEGQTFVVPVTYVWDGECVYVQSVEGRKTRIMRTNPQVCFEVDEYCKAVIAAPIMSWEARGRPPFEAGSSTLP